jgi:DNA-binding response OmpR family regulator
VISRKVLIVDDDPHIQTMLQACLADDYDLSSAQDGRTALDMLTWLHPQVMLLDLAMPVVDGLTVLSTMFGPMHKTTALPKVIVITANGSVRVSVQAIRLGASDFLEKPFTPDEVRQSIASVLNESKRDPSDTTASYDEVLSAVRESLKGGQIIDAERLLMKAGTITDADPSFLNLAGVVHEAHGRRGSARRFYERSLAAAATYEPARRNLKRLDEIDRTGNATTPIALGDDAGTVLVRGSDAVPPAAPPLATNHH